MGECLFTRRGILHKAPPLLKLKSNFADNTWSDIMLACRRNQVPDTWKVGAQKSMTINGADYTINIIGKNHDTYAAGGTAPLTFHAHVCYKTKYGMNASNTNRGGWESSAMRTTYLPEILSLMPREVQAGIREVSKLTATGQNSSEITTTADKLFLLSVIEIYGTIQSSKEGEGKQYAWYAAGNTKLKTIAGTPVTWWQRSPYSDDAFCSIGSAGFTTTSSATTANGVAIAFCF